MHETMSRRQPGNLTFTVAFVAFEGHRLWVAQNGGGSAESPMCGRAAGMADSARSCSAFMQSRGPRYLWPRSRGSRAVAASSIPSLRVWDVRSVRS